MVCCYYCLHKFVHSCLTDTSNLIHNLDNAVLFWTTTSGSKLYLFSHSMCASVAAHYELHQVFDKLIISLCKFTTLLNPPEVLYVHQQNKHDLVTLPEPSKNSFTSYQWNLYNFPDLMVCTATTLSVKS